MAGRIQCRYALRAGLGFAMLALLGLMLGTWRIRGAASGLQRRLRSASGAFVNVLAEWPSKGSALFSATNTSRCIYLTEAPKQGLRLRIGACSTGKVQPTRFLLPEGNSGLIKVAEDPSLCLDGPGHGVLQLWSCNDGRHAQKAKHLDFTLHSEPPGWIGIPHFDIADTADVESMNASDLKAVTNRVEELGYAGFSVFKGRAWLKKVNHLTLKDLKYMGTSDPCVFYLRRDKSGDISIRLTDQPETCMLAPTKLGEAEVHMAPCYLKGTDSASGGPWTAGMVFRVEVEPATAAMDAAATTTAMRATATTTATTMVAATTNAAAGAATTTATTMVAATTDAAAGAAAEVEPRHNSEEEEGGKETTTVEPSEDTRNTNRLIIALNVENVDYIKLNSNPTLKTKFKNVIQEDVATIAGLGRDNIAIKLWPGSVQAINTLSVPATIKSEDVRSKLRFDMLDEIVASNLRSVEGIDDVASGEITVRSYEMINKDIGGGTVLQLPMTTLLGIFLLFAVLVTTVVVVVRGKGTWNAATVPKAPASDNFEELEENLNPVLEGEDGPADSGGSSDPPTENDRLVRKPSEHEESAVPTEAGSGEVEEEDGEAPIGSNSQPPAATAAPSNNEDDPELKAVLAASLQDGAADIQHGNDDLNNPFAADDNPFAADAMDGAELPGANLSSS